MDWIISRRPISVIMQSAAVCVRLPPLSWCPSTLLSLAVFSQLFILRMNIRWRQKAGVYVESGGSGEHRAASRVLSCTTLPNAKPEKGDFCYTLWPQPSACNEDTNERAPTPDTLWTALHTWHFSRKQICYISIRSLPWELNQLFTRSPRWG